jgi:hypothetical protein
MLVCALGDFPFRELGVALPFFVLAGALSAAAPVRPGGLARSSNAAARLGALALAGTLLAGGFVAARNAAAIASSPWFGQRYLPPELGTDDGAWARAAARDPGEPLLHFFAADSAVENPLADKAALERALDNAARGAALSPCDFHMPLTSALLLESLDRPAEAGPFYARAVALAPLEPFVRLQAGRYNLRYRSAPFQPGSFQREEGLRETFRHFRAVLPRAPQFENKILGWLDDAGLEAAECVDLWPDDTADGLLRRARYLYEANVYNRTVEELEQYRALQSKAGFPTACWYYLLAGAVAGRTGLADGLTAAWTHVLNARCLAQNLDAINWLGGQLQTLDLALVQRFADAAGDGFKGRPELAFVVAARLNSAGHPFDALKFIERTGGENGSMQQLWADLSLRVEDLDAAETHARRALNYEPKNLAAWHAEFSKRLGQLRAQRKQGGR